ncbi:hypothetical protein [Paenibacillus sp. A3]|uniref:hypothetical protein n=1 Tax=Paenibacillus sp. A3 TaxID=1337054 RepID=UPI000A64CC02|nr:hypothetical protein [Paenibacillus sp. A3]
MDFKFITRQINWRVSLFFERNKTVADQLENVDSDLKSFSNISPLTAGKTAASLDSG